MNRETGKSLADAAPANLVELGASLAARPYARRGISMSNQLIRVALVDNHAMVREGLRLLLKGVPDIVVVGEGDHGASVVALARSAEPHVLVLDLDMPG